MKIKTDEFFIKNQIPFHKADVVKRIMRFDQPTGKGVEDLEKIKHEIDLILEFDEIKTRAYDLHTWNIKPHVFLEENQLSQIKQLIIMKILYYDYIQGSGVADLSQIKLIIDGIIKNRYSR